MRAAVVVVVKVGIKCVWGVGITRSRVFEDFAGFVVNLERPRGEGDRVLNNW